MESMPWAESPVFFPSTETPSTCPSSTATTLSSHRQTPGTDNGGWFGVTINCGPLIDERIRRKWSGAGPPAPEDDTLRSLLSSPDPRVLFRALAKVRDATQQIHLEIKSLCDAFKQARRRADLAAAADVSFRPRAVAAYLGLRCLAQIADVSIAPHPDIVLVLLRAYGPLADLFGLVLAAFFPVLEQLSVERGDSFSARLHGALLVMRSAVRSSLDVLRTRISAFSDKQQHGSATTGDIDEVTTYLVKYIKLLLDHSSLLSIILASDNPEQRTGTPKDVVVSLISSLESSLQKKSRQIAAPGLQWLFMVNNTHHVLKQVESSSEMKTLLGDGWILERREQLESYISSYIGVSWEQPLLSCLQADDDDTSVSVIGFRTPRLCFVRSAATTTTAMLSRFNLEFEVVCGAHAPWKVEDTQLRKRMRGAVAEMLVTAYRHFLEKHRRRPPKFVKFTPEEIEERLSQLYEG